MTHRHTPETDYLASDLLRLWVSDGELTSATTQVTINILRPSLVRLPGAEIFTTADPQAGATGVFRCLARHSCQ